MPLEEQNQIDGFAASIIQGEFTRLDHLTPDELLLTDKRFPCCQVHWDYELPCIHILSERILCEHFPLISISDIPLRWQCEDFCNDTSTHVIGEVTDKVKAESKKWTFSEIFARLEKAMSMASRRQDLQEAFREFEEKISLLLQKNAEFGNGNSQCEKKADSTSDLLIVDPARLGIAGRIDSNHSGKSSLGGHQKTIKTHHCSLCGRAGHHRQTCPLSSMKK
jgi:hypothetical protein